MASVHVQFFYFVSISAYAQHWLGNVENHDISRALITPKIQLLCHIYIKILYYDLWIAVHLLSDVCCSSFRRAPVEIIGASNTEEEPATLRPRSFRPSAGARNRLRNRLKQVLEEEKDERLVIFHLWTLTWIKL